MAGRRRGGVHRGPCGFGAAVPPQRTDPDGQPSSTAPAAVAAAHGSAGGCGGLRPRAAWSRRVRPADAHSDRLLPARACGRARGSSTRRRGPPAGAVASACCYERRVTRSTTCRRGCCARDPRRPTKPEGFLQLRARASGWWSCTPDDLHGGRHRGGVRDRRARCSHGFAVRWRSTTSRCRTQRRQRARAAVDLSAGDWADARRLWDFQQMGHAPRALLCGDRTARSFTTWASRTRRPTCTTSGMVPAASMCFTGATSRTTTRARMPRGEAESTTGSGRWSFGRAPARCRSWWSRGPGTRGSDLPLLARSCSKERRALLCRRSC
ncbi:hypothetical protein SVIOM342S_03579 [Streptomyces violaceorubidus]